MDLRAALRDMCKKRRTDMGDVNVVTSSEEKADSGRLESCCKRRANHAGLSVVMATTTTSPLASSHFTTHESSLIVIVPPTKDDGELVPSHRNLSIRELQNMIEKWKASVSKVVKRKMCDEELVEKLEVVQVKNDELSGEVMLERERSKALDTELRRTIEEYKATVMVGPFNARQVEFDTLYKVDMDKPCFDVHSHLGVGWDEFASKWKNSKDFYLDEGLSELIIIPADVHPSGRTQKIFTLMRVFLS
ncbi:hypothetical protein J1N35_004598 [Gossypium stocksii]|uniref:Uncharacterized protein n=1 Tax=Gossypium stocksii TaxID=47602 RepID=A0A9D3WD11_9ROSI|nr:hypothetical protein J1N35_004598 [Gossypium stocksii]